MTELNALLKLCFQRHRLIIISSVCLFVLGQIALIASFTFLQREQAETVAGTAMMLCFGPAALFGLWMFDYGHNGNFVLPESGCCHWLLRSPVPGWKIAIVPIVLRSLWYIAWWVSLAMFFRAFAPFPPVPLLLPGISLAAGSIALLVVAWRPFKRGWYRLFLLFFVAAILYCCMFGLLAPHEIRSHSYTGTEAFLLNAITSMAQVGAILFFLGSIALAVRSVNFARSSVAGVIPERQSIWQAIGTQTLTRWETSFRSEKRVHGTISPAKAMVLHELLRMRTSLLPMWFLYMIPLVIGSTFWMQFGGPWFVLVNVLFIYAGLIAVLNRQNSQTHTLPVYLSVSPVSTQTLAWTQAFVPLAVSLVLYAHILIPFAYWVTSTELREDWIAWAQRQRTWMHSDLPADAFAIRYTLSCFVVIAAFVFSRIIAATWVGFTGRQWFVVATSVVAGSFYAGLLGAGLYWFMRQTEWTQVQLSVTHFLSQIPSWMHFGLLAKGIVASVVVAIALKSGTVSLKQIVCVALIWAMVTGGVASLLTVLIPDDRLSFGLCVSATALLFPFARTLAMPMAMSLNRHV
ncbi:MAG: hypothetical protein R3C05_01385 [Pirellulaceae bacterium]